MNLKHKQQLAVVIGDPWQNYTDFAMACRTLTQSWLHNPALKHGRHYPNPNPAYPSSVHLNLADYFQKRQRGACSTQYCRHVTELRVLIMTIAELREMASRAVVDRGWVLLRRQMLQGILKLVWGCTGAYTVLCACRYYLSKARYSPLSSGPKKVPPAPTGMGFGSSAPRWRNKPSRFAKSPANNSGLQLTSSGLQLTSSGLQLTSSGLQLTSSGLQLTSSGLQLTSSGLELQVRLATLQTPNHPP